MTRESIHLAITIMFAAGLFACGETNSKGGKQQGAGQNCSASTANAPPQNQPQPGFGIINGQTTTDYPSVVMLTLDMGNQLGICSATFIGHNVVATAGHCVSDAPVSAMKIHVGSRFDPQQAVSATNAIKVLQKFTSLPTGQSEANRQLVAVDFAILITTPNSAPAISQLSSISPPVNSYLNIVGFGNTDDAGNGSGTKRRAQTTVIDNGFDPNPIVAGAIFTNQVPAPGATMIGRVAQGDSGGPLFDQQFGLVGVTSIGIKVNTQSGEINASGFNALRSAAAQRVMDQARRAGAEIGIQKNQPGGLINNNPINSTPGSAIGTPQVCI